MATILRGTDTQMDRPVAVKVLHPHLADDPEIRTRFAAEARHAASLSHPHVVGVYDQGETDLPWIVLELIDGPSLREVLATHGPLDPAQVLAVVEPLCDALHAAHGIGLIHRDVKPENVLITAEGSPKLADFGIARVMAATSHTATGTLVGSVHYLAPELVDGIEATPASDQYALAVVAYELLTGRKPLPADTPMAVALRHANEDVPPPSRYAPEVTPAMDAVIARATSRDPAGRFPDVAEMGRALREAVDSPPAAVTHLADDGQMHTLVLPSELAETSALPTRPARRTAEEDLAARRRPAPERPPRRWPRRVGMALISLVVLGLLGAGGWLLYDTVLVPTTILGDLTGRPQAEVVAELQAVDLRVDIAEEEHRLDVPAGIVTGQSPTEGTELRAGEVVQLILSLGPRVVEMPDVQLQPFTDVEALLRETHAFDVQVAEEHHDTVPEGDVLAQSPPAGSPVEEGSVVAVTLSLGIEQVDVPDMVGGTVEDATAALEAVRLSPTVTEEWSDEYPERGTVISQGVAAGEAVDALTQVPLVVSRGPLSIQVPDLRGMSVQQARDAVAGLAEVELREEPSPQPTLGPFTYGSVNEVERQIPDAGTTIQRGDSIQIFYFVAS